MIARFFRAFFWAVLTATIAVYAYLGVVTAGAREAILVEDLYSGFEPRVIEPGQTRFLPARGLPGRVRLYRVMLGPRNRQVQFRYPLKESEVLGLGDKFYVRVKLYVNYRIQAASLPVLSSQLDGGNWAQLPQLLDQKLQFFLKTKVAEFYQTEADLPGLEGRLQAYLDRQGPFLGELNQALRRDGITVRSAIAGKIYVPDAARYRAMTAAGQEILGQKINRIKVIETARARAASQRITDKAYLARLEKIGQLLRKHPHLREYLAVDRLGKNVEVLVMPSERWFGRPGIPARPLGSKRRLQSLRPGAQGVAPVQPLRQTPAPARRRNDFIDLTPP